MKTQDMNKSEWRNEKITILKMNTRAATTPNTIQLNPNIHRVYNKICQCHKNLLQPKFSTFFELKKFDFEISFQRVHNIFMMPSAK